MAEETEQERFARLAKLAQQMLADNPVISEMARTSSTTHQSFDPNSPWGQNAFDPFHGPGGAHRPRRRPGAVPDSRMLFDIQRDFLKAINLMHRKEYDGALIQMENGYRLINRYLKQYVPVHTDDLKQDIV